MHQKGAKFRTGPSDTGFAYAIRFRTHASTKVEAVECAFFWLDLQVGRVREYCPRDL